MSKPLACRSRESTWRRPASSSMIKTCIARSRKMRKACESCGLSAEGGRVQKKTHGAERAERFSGVEEGTFSDVQLQANDVETAVHEDVFAGHAAGEIA